MAQKRTQRKPWLPSIAMILGMLAFVVGLAMLLLKIGGATWLNINLSGLDVATTSDAVAVMLIGAFLTLGIYGISAWVDARRGSSSAPFFTTSVLRHSPQQDDASSGQDMS